MSFEGDAQADLKNHGGPDKAVRVCPLEHHPYWARRLRRDLATSSSGENFGTEVHVGDVNRVNTTTVQASRPR